MVAWAAAGSGMPGRRNPCANPASVVARAAVPVADAAADSAAMTDPYPPPGTMTRDFR